MLNTPPCPDDVIPERELERLFFELCALADNGAFDLDRDIDRDLDQENDFSGW